jgi:hypothetical protein
MGLPLSILESMMTEKIRTPLPDNREEFTLQPSIDLVRQENRFPGLWHHLGNINGGNFIRSFGQSDTHPTTFFLNVEGSTTMYSFDISQLILDAVAVAEEREQKEDE